MTENPIEEYRDKAAGDTVPAEAVEAAAEVVAARFLVAWLSLSEEGREVFRNGVRPALAAAAPLIVAAYQAQETGDEVGEMIARLRRAINERDAANARLTAERDAALALPEQIAAAIEAKADERLGGISSGRRTEMLRAAQVARAMAGGPR